MAGTAEKQTMFYADGPGFFEVLDLQHPGDSKINLVRSSNGRELVIRKETKSAISGEKVNDSHEVAVARHLIRVPGAVELRGWACYEDTSSSSNNSHVTYWRWYDSGTMQDLIKLLHDQGTPAPEPILWDISLNMLNTIMEFHIAGIAHQDAHDCNWLLHLKDDRDVMPEIGLTDFGRAVFKPAVQLGNMGAEIWRKFCQNDYLLISQVIRSLCTAATNGSASDATRGQMPCSALFKQALRQLERIGSSPSSVSTDEWLHNVRQVLELLSKNQPDNHVLRLAYKHIGIWALNRHQASLPTHRPLAESLAGFVANPGRAPVKFMVGTLDDNLRSIRSVVKPPEVFRSTYQNVTDMSILPTQWSEGQQAMAHRYRIDIYEDPSQGHHSHGNLRTIDTAY